MAVANRDLKSSQERNSKSQNGNGKGRDEVGAVAMETVAKRAPVTAERNVTHKDLPIENARKHSFQHHKILAANYSRLR